MKIFWGLQKPTCKNGSTKETKAQLKTFLLTKIKKTRIFSGLFFALFCWVLRRLNLIYSILARLSRGGVKILTNSIFPFYFYPYISPFLHYIPFLSHIVSPTLFPSSPPYFLYISFLSLSFSAFLLFHFLIFLFFIFCSFCLSAFLLFSLLILALFIA